MELYKICSTFINTNNEHPAWIKEKAESKQENHVNWCILFLNPFIINAVCEIIALKFAFLCTRPDSSLDVPVSGSVKPDDMELIESEYTEENADSGK